MQYDIVTIFNEENIDNYYNEMDCYNERHSALNNIDPFQEYINHILNNKL